MSMRRYVVKLDMTLTLDLHTGVDIRDVIPNELHESFEIDYAFGKVVRSDIQGFKQLHSYKEG